MARHPLDLASAALLERIEREQSRSPTTARSHLVGGIASAGAKMDDLLRNLLAEVAKLANRPPDAFLPFIGDRVVSLRRATAGQLLRATRTAARGLELPPTIAACVEDARHSASVLEAVVKLRNAAVHEAVVPNEATAVLRRLKNLLERYRSEAGWDAR